MRVVTGVITALIVLFLACEATAQEYSPLFQDFDASAFNTDEIRLLQLGMAAEGYYDGLLDGDWGRLSERAIEAYAAEKFSESPKQVEAALLAVSALGFLDKYQWKYRYYSDLGLALLVPGKNLVNGAKSNDFTNYELLGTSLNYSFAIGGQSFTDHLHSYALDFNDVAQAPYVVRKQGLAITSAKNRAGKMLYVRSGFRNGKWATVMISTDESDKELLAVVAGSMSDDPGLHLMLPRSGRLYSLSSMMADFLDSQGGGAASAGTSSRSGQTRDGSGSAPADENVAASGTGFVVSSAGLILTNAHVIEGCETIKVAGNPAIRVATSEDFDLALLRTARTAGSQVARFSPDPAQLNEDVTVAGYPFAGFLGGINVTRGSVSSLVGIQGDSIRFQITAPVQPGNSGGPVLSREGEVLGVVVSKLDALKIADSTGDIPQNINFAIRGELAKAFLAAKGVVPVINSDMTPMEPTKLAEYATHITVLITCN